MKSPQLPPIIISIIMLLLALNDFSSGYYTLLRIIVCGTSIYLLIAAKELKKISWIWIFGFIAILFNPIIKIHLDEDTWKIWDVVVALVFLCSIFMLNEKNILKNVFKIANLKKAALAIIALILIIGVMIALNDETKNKEGEKQAHNI